MIARKLSSIHIQYLCWFILIKHRRATFAATHPTPPGPTKINPLLTVAATMVQLNIKTSPFTRHFHSLYATQCGMCIKRRCDKHKHRAPLKAHTRSFRSIESCKYNIERFDGFRHIRSRLHSGYCVLLCK